nr:uncharacterized protein LOC117611018 [Osmia lignaria]
MEDRSWTIGFWNCAGIANKDVEFWETIKEWDVVILIETWLEEKGWDRIRDRMPKGYRWEAQLAKRKNKKGRAMGGMIMGVKKGILGKEGGIRVEEEKEGIIMAECKGGKLNWRIVGVYVNGDMEAKIKDLRPWLEEIGEGRRTIIGGDFNARTGEEVGSKREEEDEEGEEKRRSKDKKSNAEGNRLLETLRETGWTILNGTIEGDKDGEFTYTGARGETVIDYVIVEEEGREEIIRMEVGDRIESDHHPLIVEMRGGGEQYIIEERRRKTTPRGDWSEQGRKDFIEGISWRRSKNKKLNADMKMILEEFRKGLERGNKKGRKSKKK